MEEQNKLQIFNFEDHEVRIIMIDNEPWWVARDVCNILELIDVTSAISILKNTQKAETDLICISSTGVKQRRKHIIINESGLYKILMRSDKPNAGLFQDWLAEKVLPSIRKTGEYSIQQKIPQTYGEALLEAGRLALENEQLLITNTAQTAQIALNKPKTDFYDAVTDSTDAVDMAVAAKVLNLEMGRNQLFQFLRDESILQDNNMPYQTYIDRGLFRVIEQKWSKPDGSIHVHFKTVVYQRGLSFIQKLIERSYTYESAI